MKPKTKQLKHNRKIITACSEFHFLWLDNPSGLRHPHCWDFEIALRHTTLGRTPLDEWSARHRDLYLTTHNTHYREASLPPAGFEPRIPAIGRSQTHTWYRAATGIDFEIHTKFINHCVDTARNSLMSNLVVHEVTNGLWSNMAFTIDARHFQEKFDLMWPLLYSKLNPNLRRAP